MLITHLLLVLEVCNVTPTYRKSWAKNLLMWSDFTLGSSFKVKRWLIGFGEFSFWWIQFALVLRCARSSVQFCFSVLHSEFMFSETLKDLIRFLKREDESCDIRRQIGDSQIVQNDLIYIVKEYKDDRILLETLIRYL